VWAARMAVEAGFDMLELHCAHGYLLSAFITPLSSRYDELDGQMWLESVLIPWERVFLTEPSPEPVASWLFWHQLYCWLAKAEFTLGLALACADALALKEHEATIEYLVDLITDVQTVRTCQTAAELDPERSVDGSCIPNRIHVAAGSLAIPQGATPTVDAAGELALDTTGPQLIYYDGTAARVAAELLTKTMVVETPAAADDFLFFRAERAITVTGIDCVVAAATSAVVTVNECDANGGTCTAVEAAMTCATTNTTEAAGIDNAVIDAGDWVRVDVGTVTGTPGHVAVTVTYREDRL